MRKLAYSSKWADSLRGRHVIWLLHVIESSHSERNHLIMGHRKVIVGALAIALSVVTPLSVAASATGRQNRGNVSVRGKTIELINGDSSDPYFIALAQATAAMARRDGIHLVVQASSTFSPDAQVPYMQNAIANHVAAIVLSADGYQQLVPSLKSAYAAHIPVIVLDESEADMDNTRYALSFITSNNRDLGAAAAKEMAKLVPAGSLVQPFDSTPGLTSNLHRVTGFVSELKQVAPSIKLLTPQFTHDDPTTAQAEATDIVEAHPSIAAMYAIDDFSAQGIGTAIRALHKQGKIKLVAIDAEPAKRRRRRPVIMDDEPLASEPAGAEAFEVEAEAKDKQKRRPRKVTPPAEPEVDEEA